MSKQLVTVVLEKYNFSVDVARLTEEEVIDKLALTSPETGLISRIEYQNFLFSETVLNIEKLFHFMAEASGGDPEHQLEIRNDLEAKIYEVNPSFDPQVLVISKSGVIKLSILSDGIPLAENADWEKITNDINPFVVVEEVEIVDEPETTEDAAEVTIIEPPPFPTVVPTVRRTWERTNIEIEIRAFGKNDVAVIFDGVSAFPDEISYKVFVINKCVVKAVSLFALIDSMGLTDEVTAPTITEEIYRICVDVNPFLKFGELDLSILRKAASQDPPPEAPRRAQKKSKKLEKKSNLEFKDISKKALLTLSERIKKRVVGQDEAVDQIVETIQIASCGLRDENKPIAVYLCCGQTGVGKTFLAKVLSEELCDSQDALTRVDCSEYTEQHSVQKLIGAPPSYVGYEDGGYLTNAIQERPFSIVLFDEIEKAHSKMYDILLQVMDDARLTDGKGNVTSFKNCVLILTSNVGVSEAEAVKGTMGFGDEAILTDERRAAAIKKALKGKFRPEFLNRIDNVINFRTLTKENILDIIQLQLDKLNTYLSRREISAEFSDAIRDLVFQKGFSAKFGARPLERAIEREVIKPIAQMILRDEIKDGTSIKVDYKKDKIVIKEVRGRLAPTKKTVLKV